MGVELVSKKAAYREAVRAAPLPMTTLIDTRYDLYDSGRLTQTV